MLRTCWHARIGLALALLVLVTSGSQAQAVTPLSRDDIQNTSPSQSTCPFRSINYITQTLPQQCLTTSWASAHTAPEGTAGSETYSSPSPIEPIPTVATPTLDAIASQENAAVPSTLPDVSASMSSSPEPASTVLVIETPTETETSKEASPDTEVESPLDNANFLSFEEWKMQNLAKAGQSAENLGARSGNVEHRRRPGGISNALDSLGEDTELEIDFAGFVNPDDKTPASTTTDSRFQPKSSVNVEEKKADVPVEDLQTPRKRSKDAGKTCKERSNYASFDCAATVVKTNPESKGSTAVLVENRDSYLLNVCSAKNKFLIVELCDDILVETVALANYEFFSSMFRTFRISVSDKYPVKLEKWKHLGTFEARNSREIQAFLVENPLIWARYLRVEFLTHYGNEYYCPVSLLRVHGTTMMEEFNHDLKRAGTDEDNESDVTEIEEENDPGSNNQVHPADEPKDQQTEESSHALASPPVDDEPRAIVGAETNGSGLDATPDTSKYSISHNGEARAILSTLLKADEMCQPEDRPTEPDPVELQIQKSGQSAPNTTATAVTITAISRNVPSTDSRISSSAQLENPSESPVSTAKAASLYQTTATQASNHTSASASKSQTSSTQPINPNPTTQESFFKSVHKRLQLLESNSTLSLQYIEEQSRILRDAFSKVEKRQLAKTTSFLENLNTTVLTELREFRLQYDQIWQSTVLELSSQRQKSQDEVFALSTRLSLLADEMVFQKRMAILQFILILICLGLALFTRSGSSSSSAYLELPPLMQNAINKSSISLARPGIHLDPSSFSPSSTRPSSRYGLLRGWTHRSSPSYDSQGGAYNEGTKSPDTEYSPPTPTSQCSPEDEHPNNPKVDDTDESSDGPRRPELRQTKSSPATNVDGSADDFEMQSVSASES